LKNNKKDGVLNMIISDQTPLFLIPEGIDPKQWLLLDGIRYSITLVEIVYNRLHDNLLAISRDIDSSKVHGQGTFVFSDA